jgi:hypothetical protein
VRGPGSHCPQTLAGPPSVGGGGGGLGDLEESRRTS